MSEITASDVVIGIGGILVIAGLVQAFHQSLQIRRGKRGRIRTSLSLGKWSCRSIGPAVVMILLGALLLVGGGHYVSGH